MALPSVERTPRRQRRLHPQGRGASNRVNAAAQPADGGRPELSPVTAPSSWPADLSERSPEESEHQHQIPHGTGDGNDLQPPAFNGPQVSFRTGQDPQGNDRGQQTCGSVNQWRPIDREFGPRIRRDDAPPEAGRQSDRSGRDRQGGPSNEPPVGGIRWRHFALSTGVRHSTTAGKGVRNSVHEQELVRRQEDLGEFLQSLGTAVEVGGRQLRFQRGRVPR